MCFPRNASSNASHLDVDLAEERVGRLAIESQHLAADRVRSAAGHVDEQLFLRVEMCVGVLDSLLPEGRNSLLVGS